MPNKDVPTVAKPLIVSPCIQVCKLDAEHICTGCDRTLDEIVRWGRMTPAERQIVMDRVRPRVETTKDAKEP